MPDVSAIVHVIQMETGYDTAQPLPGAQSNDNSGFYGPTLSCFSAVRLADGPSENMGRLEVFYQGIWGSVCDDGFSDKEAVVFCRIMGYR